VICGLRQVGPFSAALPGLLHDPSHLALGTASGMSQTRARQCKNHLEHMRYLGQRPAEHPNAIVEQGAVGGMLVISFQDRPIDTQLAATRDLERRRQYDGVIEQVVLGRGLSGLAQWSRVVSSGTGFALSSPSN
jgi:hypothetical protein